MFAGMSSIGVMFADNDEFDRVVKTGLPEGCDLKIITKDKGTGEGNPVAALTFSVQLPDGSIHIAQAVVTVGNLMMALAALKGRYPHIGDFSIHHQAAPTHG